MTRRTTSTVRHETDERMPGRAGKRSIPLRTATADSSHRPDRAAQRSGQTFLPKPPKRGIFSRSAARIIAEALRRAYQRFGWRPSDEGVCRLGERLGGLQHLPMRMTDGRVIYLDLRNPVSIPYLLEGEFPAERTETLLVQELVQEGDFAVDIGANLGWYASVLSEAVGESGQVHAFEPNPFLVRLLGSLSQECPNLTVHAVALGDKDGETDFFLPDNWISGSCKPSDESAQRYRVWMATLDDTLPARPDFVKLDAEGAELAVLSGAQTILDAQDAPIWMVELSTEEARPFGHDVSELVDCFLGARRAEYAAYRIDPDEASLVPLELPSSKDFWINVLFVPASRRDRIPQRWFSSQLRTDGDR
jgi:FkbM family methyltransferase